MGKRNTGFQHSRKPMNVIRNFKDVSLHPITFMRITPDELDKADYVLLDELSHNQLGPFVKLYLSKKNFFTVFFTCINFLFFIAVITLSYFYKTTIHLSTGIELFHLLCGILLALFLIPLHELIHKIAYKAQGAERTWIYTNLRKFYFLAIADKFVANRKEFVIIALAPFVIITLILLALLFFLSPSWQLTILGAIVTHNVCCTGDFGLLSYFDFHRSKQLITFDDKQKGATFFYYRKKSSV